MNAREQKVIFMPTEADKEKAGFSKRLNLALDMTEDYPEPGKGRQVELGKDFDVTQTGAGKWLNKESIPDTHRCVSIAKKLGLSFEWLMTGRGTMFMRDIPVLDRDKFLEAGSRADKLLADFNQTYTGDLYHQFLFEVYADMEKQDGNSVLAFMNTHKNTN